MSKIAKPLPLKNIYQLKITLKNSEPPIWRRFAVHNQTTLNKLHKIIQAVMGWDTSHLYEFKIKGDNYGRPDSDTIDDRRVKLNQVISRPRTKFIYIYDFGDWWEHELQLEKILSQEEGQFYPVCLEGERACPLEEVGGIWSYYNLLDIIQDPDRPENEEMAAWAGEDFDPEVFNLAGVNERLRRLK